MPLAKACSPFASLRLGEKIYLAKAQRRKEKQEKLNTDGETGVPGPEGA